MVLLARMLVAVARMVVAIAVAVAIVLVVFIFPVAIGVPSARVFIPPFVVRGVAVLACFREVVSCMLGLLAAITMMFNGFVQAMIGLGDAHLAIRVMIRAAGGGTKRGENRESAGQ